MRRKLHSLPIAHYMKVQKEKNKHFSPRINSEMHCRLLEVEPGDL
jgi:plasmid maintenance system killer protein